MPDPLILHMLKSIENTVNNIDGKLDKHDTRIGSLEETRTAQRGIMIGGGAVVTFFAGIVGWWTSTWGKS